MTDHKPTLGDLLADFGNAIENGLKQVGQALAEAAEAVQDDYALAPTPDDIAAAVIPARRALAACLDQDDDHAAEILTGLTDAQLYAIEGAASGLAIHASRHRKTLDEQAEAAVEPEPARVRTREDLAAELRTVREALDAAGIVIASLRDQRDAAFAQRGDAVTRAERAEKTAREAERRLDEMRDRAQRAEADAADWRTTAHGYEQALRAEQAEASLQVTRLTRERDRIRQRADRADRVEATLAGARKEVEKAAAAGGDVVRIPAMRAALCIPDGTAAPDAWRP